MGCTWPAQEVSRAQLLQEVLRIWTQLPGCVQALLWLQVSRLPPLSPQLHSPHVSDHTHTQHLRVGRCKISLHPFSNQKYNIYFQKNKYILSLYFVMFICTYKVSDVRVFQARKSSKQCY